MSSKTAYLNGLTKQKQLDLNMDSLKNNLKNIKSINKSSIQLQKIGINKSKCKYLTDRRTHEINLQNKILTQKIYRIQGNLRSQKYFSDSKYSKSLNSYIKKTTQQQIHQSNLKLLTRLEYSKPTYPTKRFQKQFEHIQEVEKKMSTAEFYLTDSPNFRKRKLPNTNGSFVNGRSSSLKEEPTTQVEKNEFIKKEVILNDNRMWVIKITRDLRSIKITGQISTKQQLTDNPHNSQIKMIQIPNIQANAFLKKHCQNRLINFVQYLKVDDDDGSLLLAVPANNKVSRQSSPPKHMNPEEININNKHQLLPISQKKVAPRQKFQFVLKNPPLLYNFQNLNKNLNEDQRVKTDLKYQENKQKLQKVQKQITEQPRTESKQQVVKLNQSDIPDKQSNVKENNNQKQGKNSLNSSRKQNKKAQEPIQEDKPKNDCESQHVTKSQKQSNPIKPCNSGQQELKQINQNSQQAYKKQQYQNQQFDESGNNKPNKKGIEQEHMNNEQIEQDKAQMQQKIQRDKLSQQFIQDQNEPQGNNQHLRKLQSRNCQLSGKGQNNLSQEYKNKILEQQVKIQQNIAQKDQIKQSKNLTAKPSIQASEYKGIAEQGQ